MNPWRTITHLAAITAGIATILITMMTIIAGYSIGLVTLVTHH